MMFLYRSTNEPILSTDYYVYLLFISSLHFSVNRNLNKIFTNIGSVTARKKIQNITGQKLESATNFATDSKRLDTDNINRIASLHNCPRPGNQNFLALGAEQ
uniref:Uncharacterized protein n=1 Tax=Romanomermis culicivorax TaxID=13658 RepID=A0A915HMN0_ROMCU